MKKAIGIITFTILSSLLFSSCYFSNNSKKEDDPPIEETLKDNKQKAIDEFVNSINLSKYDDVQKEVVKNLVDEFKIEIDLASSNEEINSLKDTYKDKLNKIPLTHLNELDLYVLEKIEEFKENIDYSKYRNKEVEQIKQLIIVFSNELYSINNKTEIDNLYSIYLTRLDNIKTNDEYIFEEKFASSNTTKQIDTYKNLGYSNLYEDCNFKKGFIVSKTYQKAGESYYHDEMINPYNYQGEPTWTIAQWGSRYDILGNNQEVDGYTYSTSNYGLSHKYVSKGRYIDGKFMPGKVIQFDSETGEVYLESNAQIEYDKPRKGNENWPANLLSQSFGNNLINVSRCESIVMDCELTVDYCTNLMGDGFVYNSHTAHAVWFITIQNRIKLSKDYGKYFWFGINLWDYRTVGKVDGLYRALDLGTNALIYHISSSDFYTENGGIVKGTNERMHAKAEVRGIIEDAFKYAQDNGYLTNSSFKDLYIGGTNFGFEVPGTFNIGATFHAINVFYK